jgi:hypothetical protein
VWQKRYSIEIEFMNGKLDQTDPGPVMPKSITVQKASFMRLTW